MIHMGPRVIFVLGPPLATSLSEDIKAGGGGTSRGSRDLSHDDRSQAGASGHRVPVSSSVLKKQARARSPEASDKGFHIGATRPRPVGRQDGGHREAHSCITTRVFGRRRPHFVRLTCTSCLPSKLAVVGSLPAYIWKEDQSLYK